MEVTLHDQIIEKREYDEYDRVIETKNEVSGLSTYMTYDKYGNRIEEKDSEGLTTIYEYDKFNRKKKTIDAYGREETNEYNEREQIVETTSFDGLTTTSIYDVYGNVVESKDGLQKRSVFTYNENNQVIKEVDNEKISQYEYDANGKQIETIHVNNATKTKTKYDNNGNVIESIDALGNSKQKQYNEYGLLEMEVDERGFETKYVYNEQLLMTSIEDAYGNKPYVNYNDKKQRIEEINANKASTKYECDVYGREYKITQPNGVQNHKTYAALGNVIEEVQGKKESEHTYDALGRLEKTKVNGVVQVENKYNEVNQIMESKDANKNVSTFKYDENGNTIYANEKGFISEKEYDIYGNLIQQIDNETYKSEYTYDALQRNIEIKINGIVSEQKQYDENGNESVVVKKGVEVRNTYDANNKCIKVEVPSAKEAGSFVAIQNVTYDESENPIQVVNAKGGVEAKKFDANNNVIEESNPNRYKSTYQFDAMNNMIKAQNHEERYVMYTYDEMNNLLYKDNNGKKAEYRYNEENQRIYEKDEYEYVSEYEYEYDVFGNLIKEIKPDKSSIEYQYDKVGNKTKENERIYTYDQRNNVLHVTNKAGTIKNTYDAFNNKIATIDTNNNKVGYQFNKHNQMVKKKYAGIEVNYTYLENGLLQRVDKNKETIATYEYNVRNEEIRLQQPKALTIKTYDDMGRVVSQTTTKNNEVIYQAQYTYDANDNLINEEVDGKENTYTYDDEEERIL